MNNRYFSDFGTGCAYCLGMFLAHSYFPDGKVSEKIGQSIWLYAAADHLFEMEIPKHFHPRLRHKLAKLKSEVMAKRLDSVDEKTKLRLIEEAKDCLRWMDNYMGVKTKKAKWT